MGRESATKLCQGPIDHSMRGRPWLETKPGDLVLSALAQESGKKAPKIVNVTQFEKVLDESVTNVLNELSSWTCHRSIQIVTAEEEPQ